MRPRTKILIAAGVLSVILALLIMASHTVFTTQSSIVVQPFTNVFYTRSFKTEMIQSFPGVFHLRVTPTFTGPSGMNVLHATNGIAIFISAVGPSAEGAIASANAAADGMSQRISTNYAVKVRFLQEADRAHSCSYLLYVLSSSLNSRGN